MDELALRNHGNETVTLTPRDLVDVAVRRKRLMGITFAGILLGTILAALLLPQQYQSQTLILVKNDRVDPLVTAQLNAASAQVRTNTSEEDLNTEVELIKSRDLLEKVVIACGLNKPRPSWWRTLLHSQEPEEMTVAKAVVTLDKKLSVELIKKSNLISLSYTASDPSLARRVLTTLTNFYLDKHQAVHSSPGAAQFFDTRAEQYRHELEEAQARLEELSHSQGTVSAQTERDNALQRATEFDAALRQTYSGRSEAKQRIRSLEEQLAKTPARMVTADRNEDAQLLAQLRSQLMTLELKRQELLAKYEPGYRPVQDLNVQIEDVRNTIAAEEKTPVRQVTTDNNPTTLMLDSELGKARAELASLTARAASLEQASANYRSASFRLNHDNIQQQDLIRTIKAREQEYMLFLSKRDEARISDALDSRHIVNVAVAEPPTLPLLPANPVYLIVLAGLALAIAASAASAVTAEYLDTSFHTPRQIERCLALPILAVLSESQSSKRAA